MIGKDEINVLLRYLIKRFVGMAGVEFNLNQISKARLHTDVPRVAHGFAEGLVKRTFTGGQ
ncbi:MAG: hypothetical protein WCI73_07185 [Phycisphaerae bacterium]